MHGLDCIECGCCTFVCPAKKHLIQSIRVAKRTVIANKRKQPKKTLEKCKA